MIVAIAEQPAIRGRPRIGDPDRPDLVSYPRRTRRSHHRLAVFSPICYDGPRLSPRLADPAPGTRSMIRLSAFADEISQDPVEQLDVLDRARHPPHRVPRDPRHERPRPDRRPARGVPRPARGRAASASARSGRRSARSRSPSRSSRTSQRFERALDLADFYEAPRIRIFSFYMPARRRPGDASRRGDAPDDRARPARRRPRHHPVPREREGDLRRHRRPRARHPRDGQLARPGARLRPGQLRRGRPADRRGLGAAPPARRATSTSRTTTPKTHKNVPAGAGRRPDPPR